MAARRRVIGTTVGAQGGVQGFPEYYLGCAGRASAHFSLARYDMALKVGQRIRIVEMVGEPQYSGRTGEVTHIDDMGQVHGTWGGCALRPMDGDRWEVVG